MLNKSAAQLVLMVFPELNENKETKQSIIDGILATTKFPFYVGRSKESRSQMLLNDLLFIRSSADKQIKKEGDKNEEA